MTLPGCSKHVVDLDQSLLANLGTVYARVQEFDCTAFIYRVEIS
jgi:hypothetical protein